MNEKYEALSGLQLLGLVLRRIWPGRGIGGVRFPEAGPDSGGVPLGGAGNTDTAFMKLIRRYYNYKKKL